MLTCFRTPLEVYRTEFNRQLKTLALDESLALVEEHRAMANAKKKTTHRSSWSQNPYSHFGRGDVKLLSGGNSFHHHTFHHYAYNLVHRHVKPSSIISLNNQYHQFPNYRICEVRVPSIEKV